MHHIYVCTLPSLIFFLGDPLPLLVGVETSGVPPFLLLDLLINVAS